MDQDIRKSNRIPGSEQLTRPEEIAALSKYLGEIRRVQEEHTKLGEDNIEVPGRNTGRIPKIDSLEDLVLSPTEDKKDVELPNTVLNVEEPVKENKLETVIERPEPPKETPPLETEVRKLSEIEDVPLTEQTVALKIDQEEPRLENESLKLVDQNNPVLVDEVKDLKIDLKNTRLEDKSEKLYDQRPTSLSEFTEKLINTESDPKLSEFKEDLYVEQDDKLGNKKENIYDDRQEELEDGVRKLEGELKDDRLSDLRSKLLGDLKDINLSDYRLSDLREIIREASKKLDDDGLYKLTLKLLDADGSDWANKVASMVSTYLSSSYVSIPRAKEFENNLARSYIFPELLKENKIIEERENKLNEEISKIDDTTGDEELNEDVEKLPKRGREDTELLDSVVTPDLYRPADGSTSPDGTNRPPEQGLNRKTVTAPSHNPSDTMKEVGLRLLNGGANAFLRDVAEKTVGQVHGSIRTLLLNEALALLVLGRDELEKEMKLNKSRLPGDDVSITSVLGQAMMGGTSSFELSGFDLKSGIDKAKDIVASVLPGTIQNSPFNRPTKEPVSGETKSYFTSDYIRVNDGLKTTLRGLCKDYADIKPSSVEELNDILKNHSLITTANKINEGNILTLDVNSYWEVLVDRHIDWNPNSNTYNGGYTYLPSFKEINIINKDLYNVETRYGPWVPINSFELEKSKLTTKSLGLFDGEIIYPVSMEYTNDLRLGVVDDVYKSWRRYFQKCADVAVYNSQAWNGNYTIDIVEGNDYSITPAKVVDRLEYTEDNTILEVYKNEPIVAYYKNLAFRVTIFIMTPQLETVKKFCLLCVLKDFSETYSGETESGGGADLTLTFSIVGEFSDFSDTEESVDFYNGYGTPRQIRSNSEMSGVTPDGLKNTTSRLIQLNSEMLGVTPDEYMKTITKKGMKSPILGYK